MDTKFTKVWRTKLWDLTENVRLLFIFLDIGLALHWGNKVAEQVVGCSQTPPVRKQLEGSVSLGKIMNLEFSSDTSMRLQTLDSA